VTIYKLIGLLRTKNIHFILATHREDAIMAIAAVPGGRWEIEVFPDGSLQMEIFGSDGQLHDETVLAKKLSELVD
jgi:hypothetical protein